MRLSDIAIEQWMGWGLLSLAVLGIAAIGLVAIWPRWRRWRVLHQANRAGFQRLPLKSAEAQRLQEPVAGGLLGLGKGCNLRAVWKMPFANAYVTTIRGHYSIPTPRVAGTSHKIRVYTRFLVLQPLAVDKAFTIQNRPPDNPLARLVTGMVEQHTGVHPHAGESLLPAFRSQFLMRGFDPSSSIAAWLGESFQRACLAEHQGGRSPIDLARLLGDEGALVVTPSGLMLEPGFNYAPRDVSELQAVAAFLKKLLRCL